MDSGSFGIYVRGKRVGTETFRIEQRPDFSIATSEIKVDDGITKAAQNSEMQIAPDGTLKLYKWRSTVPTHEESTVEPSDQLLTEHIMPADQKKTTVPHIMPLSTVILDDYFFSHRELLVWRYLATGCIPRDGHLACDRVPFGALVPRQHLAIRVIVESVGRDKTMVKGKEEELNELKIDSGGDVWLVWTEDLEKQYKVVKMAIPSSGVEIVRD